MDGQFAVFFQCAAYEAPVWGYGDAFAAADVGGPAYVAFVSAEVYN
jgi:hypothetical protein